MNSSRKQFFRLNHSLLKLFIVFLFFIFGRFQLRFQLFYFGLAAFHCLHTLIALKLRISNLLLYSFYIFINRCERMFNIAIHRDSFAVLATAVVPIRQSGDVLQFPSQDDKKVLNGSGYRLVESRRFARSENRTRRGRQNLNCDYPLACTSRLIL